MRGHGSFKIYLDNSEYSRVDQSIKTINGPSLLYESPRLIYKEHNIRIQSDNDKNFEFYKLAYWPSLRVNRANCTQFDYNSHPYNFESDGIGGLRKSTYQIYSFTSVDIPMTCSRFWFYSVKDCNDAYYKEVRFRFSNIIDEEETSYTMACRTENALLYESREFPFTYGSLTISTYYSLIVNCLYYTYQPSIAEYINKTFLVTLPYFSVYVPGNSVTNQISGCTFNTIQEEIDYIIRLEKEVSFFDNIFDYPFTGNEKGTIRANYNGNLRIKNCTFTNAKCKSNQQGNVFYSSNSINVIFESCTFNSCGNSKDQVIIKMDGSGSSLCIEKCSISFYEFIEPARVIDSKCLNIKINGSKFERTAGIIFNGEWRESTSGKISITNSIFNTGKTSGNPNSFMRINFNIEFSFEFENNTISNFNIDLPFSSILSISANDRLNKFEFQNITFENNICSCLYGGGAGLYINDTSEVSFYNCHFKNNKAKQSSESRSTNLIGFNQPYFNGDGGGIQLGFICRSNDFAVKFDNCEFTNNQAYRHGGAIAIQTLSTVVITNCIFKGNVANSRFDSSELLVENHFHKKLEGRGGAIYINPSYYYTYHNTGSVLTECANTNGFLKSVSIQGCQFIENKAYDGYGIYIEGDDMGTKFDIQQNIFTDNNKPNPNDPSDPNLTIRGDILTEIHTITDKVTRQNTFSESNHKKLIYIDHYGYRIPTLVFTESEAFSFSDAFSYSGHFSQSYYFSDSGKFSKSDAFSGTQRFTKSDAFGKTEGFTKSDAFTETKGFTKTDAFSETKSFSKSYAFIETKGFSKSDPFSGTQGFTKTNAFTETKRFSKSDAFIETKGFTKSDAFIETKGFTKSDAFIETKGFTKSDAFIETKGFTKSDAFIETKGFTKSDAFIETKGFTKSDAFIETKGFTKSDAFIETKGFTKSEAFTETKGISKPDAFTEIKGFTKSDVFSATKGFTKTNAFTETDGFSKSNAFIETKGFSKSGAFSETKGFSKTGVFSATKGFTKTNAFTETRAFSQSKSFTNSYEIGRSLYFTPSKPFSNSFLFSNSHVFSQSFSFTSSGKIIFIDSSSNKESSNEISSIIESNSKSIIDDGDPSASSKNEKHSIIPIIVGVVIGFLVLIAIIVIIIFVIRRKRNKTESDDKSIEANSTQFSVNENQNQEFENILYEKPEINQDPFDSIFEEDI